MKKVSSKIILFLGIIIMSVSTSAMASGKSENLASEKEVLKIIKDNLSKKVMENELSDDSELEIDLEKYLNIKENSELPNKFKEEYKNERATTTPNGVVINETNFKWSGNLDLTNVPKKIIMHHIEASRPGNTIPVTDIHNWHLANGWSGIGYHFYVTKTGKVYRGRPEEAIGAHAQKNNTDTIGIAVEGRYQSESMPKVQKDAVVKLGQYLRGKYGITSTVKHSDVNSTSCPGKNYPFNDVKNSINSHELGKFNKLVYQTHIQDYGWQDFKIDGQISGTVGKAKSLEGIKIKTNGFIPGAKLKYRTHVEDYGWQTWKSEGEFSGTSGKGKGLEAIEIKLENAPGYEVEYRAHIEEEGWQDWRRQGEISGTTGKARSLEAVEIRIIKEKPVEIEYRTHVENEGWQNWRKNGELSGTEYQAKRLEGIKIKTKNLPVNSNIKYRTHIEDIGWQEWKKNGELSGTEYQAKRLEGIEIKLENASNYKVMYRVHVEGIGWQEWKENGQLAGTTAQAKRLEAIEIKIIKK